MVCVWPPFAFVLFIAEPYILHRRFSKWAIAEPKIAFACPQRAHWMLLVLSIVTIPAAAAGSQGWSIF